MERDPFEALHNFSLDSLQRLNKIRTLLHTVALVMRLNQDVLTEQMEYYRVLLDDAELPVTFQAGCGKDVARFSRRVRAMVRSFAMEQARIATLILLLSDGRDLVRTALQHGLTGSN